MTVLCGPWKVVVLSLCNGIDNHVGWGSPPHLTRDLELLEFDAICVCQVICLQRKTHSKVRLLYLF